MKRSAIKLFSALVAVALSTASALAASGNWNTDAGGTWNTAGNWSPAVVPGTAAGDVVGLNFDITAARTVTNNVAVTLGTLNIGDPTTPFFGYTLSTATGQALTLDNSGSGAKIVQATTGGAADTISVALALGDNLTVSNVNGLTLSGIISNTPSASSVTVTKNGPGMLTVNGANIFVASSVTVNGGTLYIPKAAANPGTNGALGNVSGGGMQIYVNSGATLSSGNNNWFGNQTLADSSLPTINITGGILAITNQYTSIGVLNLTNGAIVTSTGTGSGNYYGFQLRGSINVGGTSGSTISGTRDFHLANNTFFTVAATGGAGPDLSLTANLRNQSGDFANAAGQMTKDGSGVMRITSTGSTATGLITINGGVLQLGDGTSANGSLAGSIFINGTTLVVANPNAQTYSAILEDFGAGGSFIKTGAGTLTLTGANAISAASTAVSNGAVIFTTTTGQNFGAVAVRDGATLGVTATADSTYVNSGALTLGSSAGATLQFNVVGTTTAPLNPSSVTINGTTTINVVAPYANGVSFPLFNNYTSGTLALGSQPTGLQGQLVVSGGTVYYQVTNVLTEVWTAAVNTNWDSVTANWTNSLGGNLFVTGYPVLFDDTAPGSSPLLVMITNAVSPGLVTVSNTAKSYIIGGLAIAGSTGLTKSGNNTLTLTGTNTFTGNVAILGGTLEIGSGGGGQLGAGTYAGAIDDETLLRYNSTSAQTLSGVISGPGALVVSNGTLTLNGANTYNGGTTLSNGTVIVNNNTALGSGTVTLAGGTFRNGGTVTVNNTVSVVTNTTWDVVLAGNFNFNGNLTGGGTITRGIGANSSLFLGGDNSGFTGTYQDQANGNAITRFSSPSSGSANARWIWKQTTSSRMSLNFGNGTISWGSMTGSGFVYQGNAGTTEVQAGALGLNDIFSGVMQQGNGADILAFTKVGTGRMTLSGANTFLGGVNINNGILCVSNTSALSTAGNITFGGGTLQYSGVSGVDYSPRIASSTAAISIDLNGTNVTFASALPASNTGGLALTNSTGVSTNKLTLTAAEAYTGTTVINGGTLALSGSGAISTSTNITVASGGTFDVSGVSYTLGGNQTLAGSGIVTGAVTTASSGSAILPGGAGTVGTLTFKNNVNLGGGASPVFDVSTSHLSGNNDQVVVAGNLTLGASDTIHINALSGSSPLDETADYVLFGVAGTTTMATQPVLVFDSTPNPQPSDFSHYSIKTNGNNVVLHYSASAAPVVTSVIITNTADGSTVGTRGQSATIYVTVQPGNGTLGVGSVTANLSLLGGSSSQVLNYLGGNTWSYTFVLGQGAVVGTDSVGVTATDSLSASGSSLSSFTINVSSLTWNGSGSDANWGTGGNWIGTVPPGFVGDSVTFTGSANTSPNLEANYNVAAVTFDGLASSFNNGSTTGKTLTLSGPVNNSSGNLQVFNLAVVMNGSLTIADSGAGITFDGPISGGGLEVFSGTVTLAGANTYTTNTIIDGGATLKAANSTALPYGNGVGNVSLSGTLDINGTNAAINGLSGSGTVDNTSTDPASLSIGNADVNSPFAGLIQNTSGSPLALVKTGSGTLTLSGANTYSGGTTISNGTLIVNNNTALGSGTATLVGGTTFRNGATVTVNNNVSVVTNTTWDVQGGNFTFNGNLTGGGTITRGIGATLTLYLGGDNSGFTGTYQDQVSGNAVTRFTTASAGSANARWIWNQGTSGRMSLIFGNGTVNWGSMTGSGFVQQATTGTTIIQAGALGLNDTFSGIMQEASGTTILGLTKVGTGTMTLSGANSYTGPTIVSNGTLIVSSRKISTGDFTLTDGTTLGITLTTNGASLNMTSLTLGNNCTNTFTGTNSTTVPAINNSGALTLSGQVVVNAQGGIFATVGQYPLISSGSISGSGGFALGSLPSGVTANIITNGTAIVLNVTQVPVVGPVTITNSFSGGTLTLTWPAGQGWRLVSQTNSLSTGLNPNPTAWGTVPGYTDGSYSVTADPAKPTVFYRLVNP